VKLRYRRVIAKLSGELLAGPGGPLDAGGLRFVAREVRAARDAGAEVGLVMGGGNLARGSALTHIPPVAGHTVGMLGTVMNGVALRGALEEEGVPSLLLSALPCPGVAEAVDPWRAGSALEGGQVVLFAAGTGNPYFTTDTTGALRASEMDCDAILKGTKVDGVYTADPFKDPSATRFPRLSYMDVLTKELKVMDATAISLARENNVPIVIFNIREAGNFARVMRGEGACTIVS